MRTTAHHAWRIAAVLCGCVPWSGCEVPPAPDEKRSGEEAAAGPYGEVSERASGLSRRRTKVPFVAPPPVLDGVADEVFRHATAHGLRQAVRGAMAEARDLSATWSALHDAAALYLFVNVSDEHLVVDSDAASPWEDDAVEIFLDADGSGGDQYDGVDDVQLIVRPGDPRVALGLRSAPVRVAAIEHRSRRHARGYAIELRIPWSAVHARVRPGMSLGFDVHVDDDDDGGPRDGKLTWWSRDDEAWQIPERFGRVRLARRAADADSASFEPLGDLPGGARASYVTDLSVSGEVVVGYSEGAAGTEAVRWSRAEGLVGLGGAPSRAEAVSPNGRLVVGSGTGPNPVPDSGVIWRDDEPLAYLGGGPPIAPGLPPSLSLIEPTVVRDDGVVFGSCIQWAAYGARLACRRDAPEQLTLLTPMSVIYDVDEAGNRAGNRTSPPRGEPVGPVASLNGVDLGYPPRSNCVLPHSCRSDAQAISRGAAVVVGSSSVPLPNDGLGDEGPLFDAAFVYTQAEGMLRLPDLPGGVQASAAYAVSDDGRVIAGFGTDDDDQHAVLWIDRVPRKLSELVAYSGGSVPSGFSLLEVRAMSADGRTFAGNGINPEGAHEGFRVVLPAAP